jgi:3-oxoacyl-[acyl-carrier protein] reductase
MDLGIAGKWALVCGASKGLGLGCAQALAAEGVHVVMVARGVEALDAAVHALSAACQVRFAAASQFDVAPSPPQIFGVAADITTAEGRKAVYAVQREFDIIVTNAGGPPSGDYREWSREDWIKAMDANMLSPIELITANADRMAERGFGRIVNITSSAVKAPIDILGLSNGARSGLTGFVAGVARQKRLAERNVTINNLLPGAFNTDRLRNTMKGAATKNGQEFDTVWEARRKTIPAQRFGSAQEFGQVCAFMCSAQASYLTGQNILLDGGAYPGTY